MFDVLRSPQRSQPFVLLQPRLHLEDILPSTELHKAAARRSLPFDAAFVGIVEETGSLFAMGPDTYPLAIFGDVGVGRLLDAAPRDSHFDDEFGRDQDLPEDLDSVTRRARERRLRKLCREGSTDLRCLTGVRRLEAGTQSRFSRLLDAAPSVPSSESSPDARLEATAQGSVQAQVVVDPERAPSMSNSVMSAFSVCALALLIAFVWFGLRRTTGKPASSSATAGVQEKEQAVQQEASDTQVPTDHDTTPNSLARPDSPLRKRTISTASRPSTPRPGTPIKRPFAINLPEPGFELDGDGVDGEESEKDGEQPTKRKGVRRKRGKKKRGGTASAGAEDEKESADEPANGEVPNGNAKADAGKPVVHVVGQSALVVPPPSASTPVEPSLVVSDTVLGEICRLYSSVPVDSLSLNRFWIAWYSGLQGVFTRTRSRS